MKTKLREILIELREIKELLRIIASNTEQDKDCSVLADKIDIDKLVEQLAERLKSAQAMVISTNKREGETWKRKEK